MPEKLQDILDDDFELARSILFDPIGTNPARDKVISDAWGVTEKRK